MALAVTLKSTKNGQGAAGPEVRFIVGIVASGSYATGGDTLNLSGIFPGGSKTGPLFVTIQGQAGFVYQYVAGTSMANGKMMVRCATTSGTNAPLQEHTAVAYVSGVTGDTITGLVTFTENSA